MVQMITPWKHPQTGIYYLYTELPPHLRAEMGRRQVRRSLKTRDPAEAKRLFVLAHAELEQEMAAAEARIAAQKVADEISPERAKIIVGDFIRDRHSSGRWSRWPTLGLVWWLEDTARRVFNTDFPLAGLPMDDSPEALAAKRGQDINSGTTAAVAYRTRDEEGTQAPLETLTLGSGSCRDIAALFIDAVRHLGFGARAVSGYLFDPDVSDDDAGSTHAWAEVYLPCAGWIAFDPTHQRVGSANLIPVAVGRCNGQIMPVIGDYIGATEDYLSLEVMVQVIPA